MAAGGEDAPHSAAYFGAVRDFWWNLDHLELCARRLGLERVQSVLDVGSGVGHWGRLLGHVLPQDFTLVGVDREPTWVEEATRRAGDAGLAGRFSYREATAEALPFDDATFDLVTCQTLLIHVVDPDAVVREMCRVTKQGGLVLVSEPNNRSLTLMESSTTADASVEERIDLVRFYLTCEHGKIVLGEGNNSIGDLVPGCFQNAGLEEIEAFLSDKVSLMLPPYESDEQRAFSEASAEDAARGAFGWSRDEAWRYYSAGGGGEGDFEAGWARRMHEARQVVDAIGEGTFHTGGGDVLYLVAGRRPAGSA
jgi:ubiquinone/menaquinone biosynthesis C-methylase UbiE